MAAMTKRVNVVTRVAVRTTNPPISGSYKNIVMSTSDILKLLCKRASVEEILPDGRTVKLNMQNYYKDNGAGLDAYANVNQDEKYRVTDKESKRDRKPIVNITPVTSVKVDTLVEEVTTEQVEEESTIINVEDDASVSETVGEVIKDTVENKEHDTETTEVVTEEEITPIEEVESDKSSGESENNESVEEVKNEETSNTETATTSTTPKKRKKK